MQLDDKDQRPGPRFPLTTTSETDSTDGDPASAVPVDDADRPRKQSRKQKRRGRRGDRKNETTDGQVAAGDPGESPASQ